MTEQSTSTTAAILAGGRSRRMGTNKAFLRLSPDGPTMIEAVIAALEEAGLPPGLIVANDPESYSTLGIPTVPDDLPGAGPLGGILTALNHSQADRTLVVACDMPLLNPGLLRYMASLYWDDDALVPCWTDAQGKRQVEPLHAIYSRRSAPRIESCIAAGELQARALLTKLRVRYLDEDELRKHDPQLRSFRNVNTPEEWASLLAEIGG